MNLDDARAFVREHHRAILTTTRDDGSPQMSPVAVAVDDHGRLVVSTRETALKTRNQWIQVQGDVEILELPAAMEPLVDYYRQLSGEHPDWDDYRASMERDRRVLLRITPVRAGPDAEG
jgi:uncharacterized pyridoxamine 5'-phosphate oxidase family protein